MDVDAFLDSSETLDGLVCASEELENLPESKYKDPIEESTRLLLRRTLQAQLLAIVDEIRWQVDNAVVVTACLNALGCILIAEGSADADAMEMLREMGMVALLQGIIRAHPNSSDIQNAAQWVLAVVAGLSAIFSLIEDPQLGRSLEVVRSSFWALASCREKQKKPCEETRIGRRAYPQIPLAWRERRTLVQLSVQALSHWSSDKHVLHHAVTVLGASLCAQAADTPHDQAALAVPFIVQCLQTHAHGRDRQMFEKGGGALVAIIDGNTQATAALRDVGVQILIQGLDWFREDLKVCISLASVLAHTHGLGGLIDVTQQFRGSAPLQVACCWSINGIECSATQILELQAVEVLREMLETQQVCKCASYPAAVVRALGHLVEILLSEPQAPSGETVKQGLTIIVAAAKGSDEVEVLEYAFDALSNAACRSQEVAAFLCQECKIASAVSQILGQPIWMEARPLRSMFRTLGQLGGVAAICEVVEVQQPCAMTQQAAFRALASTREGLDSSTSQTDAIRVVGLITHSLMGLPNAPVGFHAAAARILGEFVGDLLVGDSAGLLVWEKGFVACLGILKSYYPKCPGLLYESCWAVNVAIEAYRRAQGNIALPRQIMQREGALDILVTILKDRANLDEMGLMREVTMALGLLEGIHGVRETMDAFPSSHAVQTAGCKAIGELYRLGYRFSSNDERDATRNSILRTKWSFQDVEHSELQSHVETALGAITQIALSGDNETICAPLHAREAG